MSYKAVLFDLDGTLLDTHVGIEEGVRYTLNVLNIALADDVPLGKFIGPPLLESFERYCHLSAEKAQQGVNIFREYYQNKALYKANLYDSIVDVLKKIHASGIKIGVATYKPENFALAVLQHFGILELCDVAHGADKDNKFSKPDIIYQCCKELSVEKQHVLYVGDTEGDASAASEAGVDFLGVTWGFGFDKMHIKPWPLVNTATDILDFI